MYLIKDIWMKKNYRNAFIIAVVVFGWLSTGLLQGQETAEPEKTGPSQEQMLTKVKARHILAQPYFVTVNVRARSEANRDVNIRAEISGRVIALPVEQGQQVKAGDVICELAQEDRVLRLEEAKAAQAKAQLDYDGALKLKSGGYQSRTAIAGAKVQLETAKANVKRREYDVSNLKIRAPFAGIIDQRPMEIGDFMERGDVCATVLDLNPLVIAGQVSESEIIHMSKGGSAIAHINGRGEKQGLIRYISSRSNETTRTFRVEVSIPNEQLSLRSGMTAMLRIQTHKVAAHIISPGLLSLDDEGRIGVRVVDDKNRVQYVNVDIVGDDQNGIWVTGLPEKTLLITVGQEYVTNGEEVALSIENKSDVSAVPL